MKLRLLILLLLPIACFGRKFYFSASGNNANSSTQAQNPATPWQTLSQLQSFSGSMAAGDSFLFKCDDKFSGTLNITGKNRLYFGSYGLGGKPLFWGNGGAIEFLFQFYNLDSSKFENLRIDDTTISRTDLSVLSKVQRAIYLASGSFYNCVENCNFERVGLGVWLSNTARFDTVKNCTMGYLKMIVNSPIIINDNDDYGANPMLISGSGCVITNNFFYFCIAESFDYGYDGGSVEFFEAGDSMQNNIISYNTFYKNNGVFEFGSDGGTNLPTINNKAYYNKVINCSSLFYYHNSGDFGTILRNQQFYNNIIVQDTASPTDNNLLGSSELIEAVSGVIVFRNNIFYVTNGASIIKSGYGTQMLTHTNNIYFQSGGGGLNFTADATERTGIRDYWVDTSNINALYWDYNINNTSFAYQNGVDVGIFRDFANNIVGDPPSIGAYEFVSAPVPPTPVPTNKLYIRKRFVSKQ